MTGDFSTGLMVSIVGLLTTFVALGVFIGVIYLLKLLFPYKSAAQAVEEVEPAESPALAETHEEEVVAVIAAVAYAKESQIKKSGTIKNPMWTSR